MPPEDVAPTPEAAEMAEMVSQVSTDLGLAKTTEPADSTELSEGQRGGAAQPEHKTSNATELSSDTALAPVTTSDNKASELATPTELAAITTPKDDEPPATWRKEAKAVWTKLDPVAKEEIRKRESDVLRGMGEYKQAADVGQGFHRAIGRYMPIIQQQGLNPFQLVAEQMEAHRLLAFGTPKQKADTIRRLIHDFQVPLEGLAVDDPAPSTIDPQVKSLQDRLDALQSTVSRTTETQSAAERGRLEGEVTKFSTDPAHPFFEEVAEDIASLISKGACATLQEAYDTAVARNPAVRQKSIDLLLKQQAEATSKATKERAEAARKSTAANVRSTSKARGPTAPKGSMEDTLRETAEKLFS